jgi:tetratricopeptide (TPR) repeat protein
VKPTERGDFEKARDFYKQFLETRATDAAMIYQRLNEIGRMIDSSAAYGVELEIRRNGIQAGLRRYQAFRSDSNNPFCFSENEFNALGYRLMQTGKLKDALEVFKLNVELYPESANVYDSLAEA